MSLILCGTTQPSTNGGRAAWSVLSWFEGLYWGRSAEFGAALVSKLGMALDTIAISIAVIEQHNNPTVSIASGRFRYSLTSTSG